MPDHTSAVPQYTFADTLAEQEAQLQDNSLLQQFRTTRIARADDPFRPHYHFYNPHGRLNDPNGLCYWQDRWHLFYQAFPPEDPRPHWGHAISDDLVHWHDLPYALCPHPEHGCWSGASLVDGDRVLAHYYGHPYGNSTAISRDPLLLNWTKLPDIIPVPETEPAPYRVYDPCIWKKDGVYYSLSGGTQATGPGGRARCANYLFRSPDLVHWEYMHPFVEDDLFTPNGDDGACPYFWPIADQYMLLIFSHMRGGRYILGDYDTERDKLVATDFGLFNFGAAWPGGVHAPSACPDGQGGLIVLFNVNWGLPAPHWTAAHREIQHFGCWEGEQIMSLPRRLSLTDGTLSMTPAGHIEALRCDHVQITDRRIPANQDTVLEDIAGNAIELHLTIDTANAPMVALDILRSPDKQEYTRIAFYRDRGIKPVLPDTPSSTPPNGAGTHSQIVIDTSCSSTLADVRSRPPEVAPVLLDPNEHLELRVFIDKSIVEVFVNNRQCAAVRAYPERADSTGVSLQAQGRDARLLSLDAWHMADIFAD